MPHSGSRKTSDAASKPTYERFSVSMDEAGRAALEYIRGSTHLRAVADVVRAGLAVIFDLIAAENNGYTIVLRKGEKEWSYSPHRPGQAVPLHSGGEGKVVPFPPPSDRDQMPDQLPLTGTGR